MAQINLSLEKLDLEGAFAIFTKLTASIKAEPTQRAKIRDKVNPHTVTLLEALNKFIADGKRKLPNGKSQLVIIVDNLDRIPPIFRDNGRSNHEEIFLDRNAQLKGLDCHIIYTVPIAFVYSKWANEANAFYGSIPILPMIMVKTPDDASYLPGIAKLKEALSRRITPYIPGYDLETDVFDSKETLERLCFMSGGHIRELMQMAQNAIRQIDALPISAKAAQRAITELRSVYQRAVDESEWKTLAQVAKSKTIRNDNEHRSLLQRRCILEYRYFDADSELQNWYDVHPLIRGIARFKEEYTTLKT